LLESSTFIGLDSSRTRVEAMETTKRETEAMDTASTNFYVEQTQCAMCNRPTTRVGRPEIDAMKGKEPAVCGFCLVQMPRIAAEQVRKDAD
jgi:hypothetical protein